MKFLHFPPSPVFQMHDLFVISYFARQFYKITQWESGALPLG